jgi:hypothetical protein
VSAAVLDIVCELLVFGFSLLFEFITTAVVPAATLATTTPVITADFTAVIEVNFMSHAIIAFIFLLTAEPV